jgi:hypothetical protein
MSAASFPAKVDLYPVVLAALSAELDSFSSFLPPLSEYQAESISACIASSVEYHLQRLRALANALHHRCARDRGRAEPRDALSWRTADGVVVEEAGGVGSALRT